MSGSSTCEGWMEEVGTSVIKDHRYPVRTLTVHIEGRPPTPNARPGNWQQDRRHRTTWRDRAAQAADRAIDAQHGGSWETLERARVTVTFILPDRRDRDLDNLVASSKVLTDGLVQARVLAGDSIRHITAASYGWEYRKGETATDYVIEEEAPDGK